MAEKGKASSPGGKTARETVATALAFNGEWKEVADVLQLSDAGLANVLRTVGHDWMIESSDPARLVVNLVPVVAAPATDDPQGRFQLTLSRDDGCYLSTRIPGQPAEDFERNGNAVYCKHIDIELDVA